MSDFFPSGLEPVRTIYWRFINNDFTISNIAKKMPNTDLTSGWLLLKSNINHPYQREIGWKISHDILPLNYKLHRFHIARSAECPICTGIETNAHRFLSCHINRYLWTEILSRIKQISKHPINMNEDMVLYNILPALFSGREKRLIMILVNQAKTTIWSMRNKIKYEYKTFNDNDLVKFFYNDLKRYITIEMNRQSLGRFTTLWLTQPSFVEISTEGAVSFVDTYV